MVITSKRTCVHTIPVEEVKANVRQQVKHFPIGGMQASTPLVLQNALGEPHYQFPNLE